MHVSFKFNVGLDPETRDWIMSVLSDAIAKLTTSADAAIARVGEDVAALRAQVAALQATVDAGGATPADLQALADAQAKLDALDPTVPATLPPVAAAAMRRLKP